MFASAIDLLASLSGLFATAIVVGGFLAHVRPALTGKNEAELRRATAFGGLLGMAIVTTVLLCLRLTMG